MQKYKKYLYGARTLIGMPSHACDHVSFDPSGKASLSGSRAGYSLEMVTNEQIVLADVNQDTKVNALDATYILQYAAAIGTGSAESTMEEYIKRNSET